MIVLKLWVFISCIYISCVFSKSIDNKNTSDDSSSSSEETTTIDDLSSTTIESNDIPTTTTAENLSLHNGEVKLPIDLLSEDILLDPNVVLARLSKRDVNLASWNYQQKQYGSWDNYRSSPIKRRYTNNFDDKTNQYRKKIKIYPIFPGK